MSTMLVKANKLIAKNHTIEQNPETYIKPSVMVYEPNGWYSSFLVNNVFIVETVDIYTYQCQHCEDNMNCSHTQAVREYILEGMEMFAQACQVHRETIPEMKIALDKLTQHTDLIQHTKEMSLQVQEMRQAVRQLRDTVLRNAIKN